jgi:hypothetical protein
MLFELDGYRGFSYQKAMVRQAEQLKTFQGFA